ncbi:LysR family transcriptional regulator [Pseudomonas capsici]|uniref:LysR family transcriptional regulator n=1 Tax=Pseudomonas capsici TaxID=2810614 RepID=UPI000E3CCAD2|nr:MULTISPECIES: LysR family transcriptional regulator [Pseudomonas]MCV4273969.1 LysR family transcriptional regulator [Pseudomonas capsici]GFM57796.1 LysR family transcriptional regulator [Pseudomonas cichorii]GFM62529.1 LysR family transcriptional regulator [Pseudomonas cichorii]
MQDLSLRHFHSVARTGSLSAAAEELHVAVSAVSRQISNLEDQLGLQLFERKPRGMQLTGPGELLLAYATRNSLEVKNVIAEMRGLNSLQQHRIAMACPEGMAWEFLPRVAAEFRGFHPGASFDLQVVDSARASDLVKEGQVDLALTFSLTPAQGVEIALSVEAPISALMPSTHPLAQRKSLRVRDLCGCAMALPYPGSTIRYLFDIACHLEGINVEPAYTSQSLGAIYTVVRHSQDVVALCGPITVSAATTRDNLVLVPMNDPHLRQRSLQVQIMAGRKLPVLVRYFLSFLEEQMVSAQRVTRS